MRKSTPSTGSGLKLNKVAVSIVLTAIVLVLILSQESHSQAGVDDFRFIGEKAGACDVAAGYTQKHSSEHIGKNLILTCVKNNDDRVKAIGEKEYSDLGNTCPAGYSLKYSSEHIGLNLVRTCSKVDPAPAVVLGEKETTCPTIGGVAYTFVTTYEHIGLNNLTTCKKPATLSVSLSANPSSGPAPLNNVDLTATVSNAGAGNITYDFYCQAPYGAPNFSIITTSNPYTAADICNYVSTGTYTAKVIATQGGESPQGTATIIVSKAPKIKEILP